MRLVILSIMCQETQNICYLGGTARMAMINLTIVASVPDDELPTVVSITGSPRKLAELENFALIKSLRERGVVIEMIDRNADDIVEQICKHGKPFVIWTNYPSQDIYNQAVAAIAPGGNINNYAGASNPDIYFSMTIPALDGNDVSASAAR